MRFSLNNTHYYVALILKELADCPLDGAVHISEHTGHGIPIIVNKYGQEAFEITNDYINVIIPFDKEVMAVGGNFGGNPVGNNELENYVISKALENNKISAKAIAEQFGACQRTVERTFASLKEKVIS